MKKGRSDDRMLLTEGIDILEINKIKLFLHLPFMQTWQMHAIEWKECECAWSGLFVFLSVFFLPFLFFSSFSFRFLPRHMGNHTLSSKDLSPFLEGGCCYAENYGRITIFYCSLGVVSVCQCVLTQLKPMLGDPVPQIIIQRYSCCAGNQARIITV